MYFAIFETVISACAFMLGASSAGLEAIDGSRVAVPSIVVGLYILFFAMANPLRGLPPVLDVAAFLAILTLLFAVLSKIFLSCEWKQAWTIAGFGFVFNALLQWLLSCTRN